jgi:hypothetical protein
MCTNNHECFSFLLAANVSGWEGKTREHSEQVEDLAQAGWLGT